MVFILDDLLLFISTELGLTTLVEGSIELISDILGEGGTAILEISNGTASDISEITEKVPHELLQEIFGKNAVEDLYSDLALDIKPIGSTTLRGFVTRVGVIVKNVLKNGSSRSLSFLKNLITNIITKGVEFARNHLFLTLSPGVLFGTVLGGTKIFNTFKKEIDEIKNKFSDIDSHLISKNHKKQESNEWGYMVEN